MRSSTAFLHISSPSRPVAMSEVAAQIYRYSALPSPHSIRLIKLKPGITNIWSDITLSLRITSLNEAVEFDALPYTWGDPLPPFSRKDGSHWGMDAVRRYSINIDGYLLEVTANLNDALHALADTGTRKSAMKSQYIWIDGIYINQEDPLSVLLRYPSWVTSMTPPRTLSYG